MRVVLLEIEVKDDNKVSTDLKEMELDSYPDKFQEEAEYILHSKSVEKAKIKVHGTEYTCLYSQMAQFGAPPMLFTEDGDAICGSVIFAAPFGSELVAGLSGGAVKTLYQHLRENIRAAIEKARNVEL